MQAIGSLISIRQLMYECGEELAHARQRRMTPCLVNHPPSGHLVFVLVSKESYDVYCE
jgi:hypothetical protein